MSDEAPVISRRTFARLAAAAVPILGAEPLVAVPAVSDPGDTLRSELLMRLKFAYPNLPDPPQSAAMRRTIEISGKTVRTGGAADPPHG
jgi:hypothetical protein